MLLETIRIINQTVLSVLDFIENHTEFIGIITAVVTSSLWLRKFIKQKRAEAFFDFYTKLLLRLKSLKALLEDYSQLNCLKNSDGNIYSLIYTADVLPHICPDYKPPNDELDIFQSSALELKSCILDSNSNVYPTTAKQKDWYESQHIIFSFCEFLERETLRGIVNNTVLVDDKPIHIVKCQKLVESMNYIIKAIENEKY